MANVIKELLNTQGMALPIYCGGMTRVGIGVSGTWTGTITFEASNDGVRWVPVGVTPFASGTSVLTATANGNWQINVGDWVAVRARLSTLLTGSPVITLAAAIDASWQDAYLASTSRYVTAEGGAGAANTITQAAQANRAWRLRTCTVSFSTAPAAAVKITVSDGASSVIWEEYAPGSAGSYGVKLPVDPDTPGVSGGGVVNTPGNSMVVTCAAPGGAVVAAVSCEFIPA